MPWNNSAFDSLLTQDFFADHAEVLQWAQAVRCGCSNTPDNPSNSACGVCGGLGYFYPHGLQYTHAILTAVTQTMDLVAMGLAEMGDLVCDQPPGATSLSQWDLVLTTWTTGVPFIGETLVRGSGATDTLTYRANPLTLGDGTQGYVVVQTDPVTAAVTIYPATDYTVSGKTITWGSGGPTAGSSYTIRYNATYEWAVLKPGLVRIERGTDFGPRTILRKREIALPNAPGALLPG